MLYFSEEWWQKKIQRIAYISSFPKLRLSVAIRYFTGGCPYDIMLIHGVSYTYLEGGGGVVDAVNSTKRLEISFPSHLEQRKVASDFYEMSGAMFDNFIGALDGLLVWITKPSFAWCKNSKCGEAQYECHRKDKSGMNLQARRRILMSRL